MSRKKSSSGNGAPFVDGRHNLTSLELCEGDDLATTMTVDVVLGFVTHKMDKNYNPSLIDKKLRVKWKEIMQEFMKDFNYESTYKLLIASEKIKSNLKNDERFKRHIFRFLYLFDKRSGIEVRPCFRYENEGRKGAAIFATKEWEKGCQISTLFGCIAEMSLQEEEIFHELMNEFSVMYSTRKNCSQLWLGPAAYVNHDCKPNCRFTEGNDDSKMTLETLRLIHPGDELLIYYGNNFFGLNNAECECFTCELRDQGLFSIHFQNNMSYSMSAPDCILLNDEMDDSLKRIITRSKKEILGENKTSFKNGLHGTLDRLKKSEDTYSLRVTYSRIDRVKKRILSQNIKNCNKESKKSNRIKNTSQKSILGNKPKNTQPKLAFNISSNPSSLRRSQRLFDFSSNTNHAVLDRFQPDYKLKIKLRKNVNHPNHYEHINVLAHNLLKPSSDSNIFSRITQLYLSSPDFISHSDIPPPLSPWFCSKPLTTIVTKKHHNQKRHSKTSHKVSSNHNLTVITTNYNSSSSDECPPAPETSSSDIHSHSPTSSPTIPVLEIESETELAPPHLVCELCEPEVPNSPNKVMTRAMSRCIKSINF